MSIRLLVAISNSFLGSYAQSNEFYPGT